MGRKAGRRPANTPPERWRAIQDPRGRWIIVNEQGEEPLRSSDPFVQLEAAHLAAAAPGMKAMLEELLRRIMYLEPPYTRDHARIRAARAELAEATPSADHVYRAWRGRGQLELDLPVAT